MKTKVAKEFRLKYGMEMPTMKLARIMYKENELLFKDVRDAQKWLAYIEGKDGAKSRKNKQNKEFHTKEYRTSNPYNLPKSEEIEYKPYKISGHKKIGIINDVHLPYHNLDALTEALTILKKEKIDGILFNGDIIDCHTLSRFVKDPKKRDFKYEIDSLKLFFDAIDKILNCKIYYKLGNHELRYEHYLYQKAHEISGIEDFEFSNIIKAKERGIQIIESNRFMKLNSLNGIHGHEYIGGISAPVNIARGLYLRGKVSAFQGHNHTTSEHTETDMNGKITTTYSIGCLCELSASYMPLTKWNHGFAFVELDSNGKDYRFNNKRIYKGKTL